MSKMEYEMIAEVNGRGQAEVIASYLEAEGICVELIQDSVSHSTYVLPFALVQIFVRNGQAQRARDLIEAFQVTTETEDIQVTEEDSEA